MPSIVSDLVSVPFLSRLQLYLQARFTWRGARLLRPLLQFTLIMMAFYTGLSRVSDHKHHPSDVLAGFAQGALVACCIVSSFSSSVCKQALGCCFVSVSGSGTTARELAVLFSAWYPRSHPPRDPSSKMRIMTASFKPVHFHPTGSAHPLLRKQWQNVTTGRDCIEYIQLTLSLRAFRVERGRNLPQVTCQLEVLTQGTQMLLWWTLTV